ncbi:hypothetical protein X777_15470 [Ooceraea biroi]|uniref:Uncharacterized protein n=1 Tax=Ooceraea biroi TaxID=2015173 RepID=A0A026VVE3_OOCBI|nr:hypothetical protein X777_15470 [Ooceraea biroi]
MDARRVHRELLMHIKHYVSQQVDKWTSQIQSDQLSTSPCLLFVKKDKRRSGCGVSVYKARYNS